LLSPLVGCKRAFRNGAPSVTAPQFVHPETDLVLLLPGVMNLGFTLAPLAYLIRREFPNNSVEIMRWGPRFGWIANLRALERNLGTARAIAEKLTVYSRTNPGSRITVVGYSGGGGLAVLVVEALPGVATVDRLILVAPAISPDFPLLETVLPRVRECMVVYASRRDLHLSRGVTVFGNIDGSRRPGAGAVGFALIHPKLVQVQWHRGMLASFHFGDHFSYLSPLWQRRFLLPALDPGADAHRLRQELAGGPGARAV